MEKSSYTPNVFIFTRYYLPGFRAGGPIRSISNLVYHLERYIDFHIVTSDRDMGLSRHYNEVCLDTWIRNSENEVIYLSRLFFGFNLLSLILRNRKKSKVLYFNSFWDPMFTILPLIISKIFLNNCKVIIAPRGEFLDGALGVKRLKKNFYLWFFRSLGFVNNVVWHTTSYDECDAIRKLFKIDSNSIFQISNFSRIADKDIMKKGFLSGDTLRIVFLSRISPKKNLAFALSIISRLEFPTIFNIYGVIDDVEYWNYCQKLISQMNNHVIVIYHGSVDNRFVLDIFSDNDVFFLPTKSENFGHAIVESLLAGTPVLLSDKTPWRNLSSFGVGWDLPLNSDEVFLSTLNSYYSDLINGVSISRYNISQWINNRINHQYLINDYKIGRAHV